MKYIRIFFILAFAALLAGCAKEQTEQEKLDARIKDGQKLSVKYLRNGNPVSVLAFTHGAIKATVGVDINDANLKWQVESDKDWCSVEAGEHSGPGSIVLNITANDTFTEREAATLTFVAGAFRGASIQVTQTASAFVVSQPFFVSNKGEDTLSVDITTLEGTDWEIAAESWLTATKGAPVTAGGETVTPVEIIVSENTGESRYGAITLTSGMESDQAAVYQFGTDINYKPDGTIFFGEGAASLSLTAPGSMVRSLTAPAFVTSSIVPQADGTDLITLSFEDNVSDTNEPRDIPVTLTLNNSTGTHIALPIIEQDFTPAHGLNSPEGFKLFARTVAEGGSTASWEREGVVTLLQDINMAGVSGWTGVGDATHPFTGSFDGGNFSIKNLTATAPIFNKCKDATVKNIGVDKLCNITLSSGTVAGGIAAEAEGTRFEKCVFGGKLTVNGGSANMAAGLIVGKADTATVVTGCTVEGDAVLTFSATAANPLYIGGIAGFAEGEILNSEMRGSINLTQCPATASIGGITSVLNEHLEVSGNSFRGSLSLSGTGGTNIKMGGLYGTQTDVSRTFDFSTDHSAIAGEISISGFGSNAATLLYAGGMIGYLEDGLGLSVKGYACSTGFNIDHSGAARAANWFCIGGLLGGMHPEDVSGTLLFEDCSNSGVIGIKYSTGKKISTWHSCVGGLVGHVNGPASFKHCSNTGEVGKQTGDGYCAKANGYSQVVGGIAGLCYGGDQLFENCSNDASITNNHYNNNPLLFIIRPSNNGQGFYDPGVDGDGGIYTATATGGILGAYNYMSKLQNHHLTVKDCNSKGKLCAYRGTLGGIAGFAGDAEFTNCEWRGSSVAATSNKADNQASEKGGISGALSKATVTGCTARGNLEGMCYGSAETGDAGGIVAYVVPGDSVVVSGSKYYGEVTNGRLTGSTTYRGIQGGIIARNDAEGTKIENCSYGGKVGENSITAGNVATYAVDYHDNGASGADTYSPSKIKPTTVTGISYWTGN
ncbi:MAG: hypothetical protein J5771_05465 [Bacteroidales bacterium]|nr:hypothetical protein [Bacteroidales bacterium]